MQGKISNRGLLRLVGDLLNPGGLHPEKKESLPLHVADARKKVDQLNNKSDKKDAA